MVCDYEKPSQPRTQNTSSDWRPCLLHEICSRQANGMAEIYVDDLVAAENNEFMDHSKLTGKRFMAEDREFDPFVFAGIHMKRDGKTCVMHQENYAKNVRELPLDFSFANFRGKILEIT